MRSHISPPVIKLTGNKTCRCPGCGKRVRRSKTFWQTLQPCNRKGNGEIKIRKEIEDELKYELAKWKVRDEWCNGCFPIIDDVMNREEKC
jgi:hypothetical protein